MADKTPVRYERQPDDRSSFESIGANFSFLESAEASFKLARQGTFLESLYRNDILEDLEENDPTVLQPEELNERFPEVEVPFSEPTPLTVAWSVAERARERQKLQEVIANGPQGWTSSGLNFGASLIAHAMDPLEIGTDVLVGKGIGILGKAFKAGRAARAASKAANLSDDISAFRAGGAAFRASLSEAPAALTVGQRALRATGEGFVANLAIEPFVAGAQRRDQIDYGIEEIAFNATIGALAYGGISYGAGKLANFLKKSPDLYSDTILKAMKGRVLTGKSLDASFSVINIVRQTDGSLNAGSSLASAPNGSRYVYTPISETSTSGKSFYASSEIKTNDVTKAKFLNYGEDYGNKGVYLSDNPAVKNGEAAGHMNSGPGSVLEVDIGDKKLIDLQGSINKRNRNIYKSILDQAIGKENSKKVLKKAKTMEEAIEIVKDGISREDLPEQAIDAIADAARKNGFDGYLSNGKKVMGVDRSPHNSVYLFDRNAVNLKKAYPSDPDSVPKPTEQDIADAHKSYQSDESDFLYDSQTREAVEEFQNIKDEPVAVKKSRDIEKEEELLVEQVEELDRQNLLTADEKADFDVYKKAKKDSEIQSEIIKAAKYCLKRTGS